MTPITLPPELELPDGQAEVSAVIEVIEGQAFLVAIDGVPLSDEGGEEEVDDMDEEGDFLAAVERGMTPQ